MQLRARASQSELAGTWGFGLWNDPFGLSIGFGGGPGRLPALPNAAWFFFASPENHLSLHNSQPGSGTLAGGYRSAHIPSVLFSPAIVAAPLLLWPAAARVLRWVAAGLIQQDLRGLNLDPTAWHQYGLVWEGQGLKFQLDQATLFEAELSPKAPLGLVLWLDNQYAAWRPDGRLAYGTLVTPEDCWIEITDLHFN